MSLTTKVLLNKVRQKQDGSYPLTIRVTYNRKVIYIPLGYTLYERDFDEKNQRIKTSSKKFDNVTRLNNQISAQVNNVFNVISKLEEEGRASSMPMKEIKKAILGKHQYEDQSVFQFMENIITNLKDIGKFGNAQIYKDSLNAWKNFRDNHDLKFQDITHKTLKDFERYFLRKGRKENTVSVYLRTFRSAYNQAIDEGIVKRESYPFDHYKIPGNKTRKRAVSLDVIAKIEGYKPESNSRLWDAKNYFLFSFYTRGMNFVDMAHLKLENVVNGRIYYTRQKTGGEFTVKIHQKAQSIIELYALDKKKADYLFPIVKSKANPERVYKQVKNEIGYFNKALKTISKLLDLDVQLSTYVARHSYATGLKMHGTSIEVIKESLGHTNVAITEDYLKSFENSVVDDADNALFS
ncbi:site-specific integrase [Roseivirga pacifica]|uniref:site-specific integrase n=1 Tax=Roseivirga pacifica TaxID=1267423 RepID=UPI00227C2B8C|nr:site-specific integrase [Roseivirga pacifica]